MKRVLVTPNMGDDILVVMDNCPTCIDMLRRVCSRLNQLDRKYFTLLHCCPAIYWEHGGNADANMQQQIDAVWQAEEAEFNQTQYFFEQAKQVLQEAGVPASHIYTTTASNKRGLLDATMSELKLKTYSGVIISSIHTDIINRLYGRGVTDIFRRLPKVTVWPIDTEALAEVAS